MTTMMWFRSDLRVMDNPALHAAASGSGDGVVAVFVLCPGQWGEHDMAPIKADFVLRNLVPLSKQLAGLKIALRVLSVDRFADVPGALLGLAREVGCDRLCFNREYELNERTRDDAVEDAFVESGIRVDRCMDQCLFEPGELLTGGGGYYKVFTPFKKSWISAYQEQPARGEPLPMPRKQKTMVGEPDEIPGSVDGFDFDRNDQNHWEAGEPAANRILKAFLAECADSYKDDRDLASVGGTSRLSPYLVSGVISLRVCVREAVNANKGKAAGGSAGIACWISELIWREFYKHVLVGFPRVSMHRPFQLETDRIEWKQNDEHFHAWCEGRTGFPIVDAAMRQLVQTGWMHNRLRMITAMFLTKNLFLDWRLGERFFMEHLIDGDLSANNGGWQWSASTGTDAAPYFRIFNPYSQSKKCDLDGAFIRRYVPELGDVEGAAIHDPSTIPALLRSTIEYPEPIVDHKTTRAHAIEAFKRIRG